MLVHPIKAAQVSWTAMTDKLRCTRSEAGIVQMLPPSNASIFPRSVSGQYNECLPAWAYGVVVAVGSHFSTRIISVAAEHGQHVIDIT